MRNYNRNGRHFYLRRFNVLIHESESSGSHPARCPQHDLPSKRSIILPCHIRPNEVYLFILFDRGAHDAWEGLLPREYESVTVIYICIFCFLVHN